MLRFLEKKRALIGFSLIVLLVLLRLKADSHSKKYQINRQKSLVNKSEKNKFLLVLATTWNLSPEKLAIYENTAQIWRSWPLLLQPVLYRSAVPKDNVNRSQLDMYLKNNWKIKNVPKVACGQIPVLKSMILEVRASFTDPDFYGYANADILFDQSLISTLKTIKEKIPQNKPILIVGQRINVNFTNHTYVVNSHNVRKIAKSGDLMTGIAVDYFITNRHFPWNQIFDFVVGRSKYDNWLISFANSQNMIVIDATKTLTAVHQTTTDGNNAGWKHPNKYCNVHIIQANSPKFKMTWGSTVCAPYYTKSNRTTNEIDILYRKTSRSCRP
ncbi:uncharacterized protein LOC106874239 [Octopus bimaculoides]|uniref:Uncharacterized protein n=1 Tax=Octopus bimaculoides TaxID=37653 RepID=A0A0L8GWW6_OCTBM|nr:uncharacterized protein LOC106874239 [Octopus bimaculoides]|eukprot:XP_014777381.1 PREDICTED: uncharacterized protein LOC106874239 [Octopus bimaculoides]